LAIQAGGLRLANNDLMSASVRHAPEIATAAVPMPTHRLADLPTYVFAWLDELKAAARARGADLIDLGMGNPDQPTPPAIVEAVAAAYRNPANHGYPPFRGTPRFREAAAAYMKSRFGVEVDPDHEVICLSGAKEGIAHLTMAYTDESTVTIVPDIYYPVHGRATGLVGGKVHLVPLRSESGFIPDLSTIPKSVLRAAKLLVLNYPHNPTGAVAPLKLYEEAVALCRANGITLLSDLAYVELTYDGASSPSALEVPGAKDVTVEFHSFSKSFNMAGSRIGFAVGGKRLIDALYAVRTNMGYGTPSAIQEGAAYALDHAVELIGPNRARYQRRRDALVEGFRSLGWDARPSSGSMFLWLPVPRRYRSQQWTERLIDEAGVVVTPGNAFGPGGEGFFRVSLIADEDVLASAIDRLRRAGIRFENGA
jgi:LL-diaminopimelate aminotransferase